MLYIGAKHIEKIVNLNEMMDTIEKAYDLYARGLYQMPNRLHVDRPEGTILYMPCFSNDISGTKIVSTFPGNREIGIPTIQGIMILNNSKTGESLAVMDGATITAYRTGAVGGVGIRYTTRKNCESVGLIGVGVQGFFQILYACTARRIKKIYIFDINIAHTKDFKARLEKILLGIDIEIAENITELVSKSEIIITATSSKKPVLPDDAALLKGKHIIAIGSYKHEMRELPKALYDVLDDIYIDTELALDESGDLIIPVEKGWYKREDMKIFGQVYKSLSYDSLIETRTTLYKSVGMALFDLMTAEYLYNTAIKKKLGVDLGD